MTQLVNQHQGEERSAKGSCVIKNYLAAYHVVLLCRKGGPNFEKVGICNLQIVTENTKVSMTKE